MLGPLITLCLAALVQSQVEPQFLPDNLPPSLDVDESPLGYEIINVQEPTAAANFILCTYSNESFAKCNSLLQAASRLSIELPLSCCYRADLSDCLEAVRRDCSVLVVLSQADYQEGRQARLRPALFARERRDSFYIAVAPRDISFVEYSEAQLAVNISDESAFYAAVAFNTLRGIKTCPDSDSDERLIRILNSAQYEDAVEDILLCIFTPYADSDQAESCNFDVGLQRAVFISPSLRCTNLRAMRRLFQQILENFSASSSGGYNFFADDVIFKHNTIAFDVRPTYYNNINEKRFNLLNCESPEVRRRFGK